MRARRAVVSGRWWLMWVLVPPLVVGGCESAFEPAPAVAVLQAVTPTDLTAQVDRGVDQPPAVLALDAQGKPVGHHNVEFITIDATGASRISVVRTDSYGVAAIESWRLGRKAGPETMTARTGVFRVVFHAVALPGPPSEIWALDGGGQIATPASVLPLALRVWVHDGDRFWNSVGGVPVTFTVVSGGGSIAGGSTATDSSGVAVAGEWTLGTSADVQQVRVQAGLAETLITAFATCDSGAGRCGTVSALCASPEGCGRIAFVSSKDGDPEIYSIRPDGTDLVRLTYDGGVDSSPEWSPDGAHIAFISDRSGWEEIHVMDADGSNVVQRTFAMGSVSSPSWSPDGASITYMQSVSSAGAGLWNVEADVAGPEPARLSEYGGCYSDPAWSPDGSRLAYVCDWGGYASGQDIFLTDPDGTNPVWLTGIPFDHIGYSDLAWSPDGGRLALTILEAVEFFEFSGPERTQHVGVMALDGFRPLPLSPSAGGRTSWSPDGEIIAFTSPRGDVSWIRTDGLAAGLVVEDGHSPDWSR